MKHKHYTVLLYTCDGIANLYALKQVACMINGLSEVKSLPTVYAMLYSIGELLISALQL